jgi:transposase InsO family protein
LRACCAPAGRHGSRGEEVLGSKKAPFERIRRYSRRILAWKLALRLEPQTTCQILLEAAKNLPKDAQPKDGQPKEGQPATVVVADSGVENVNRDVDALLDLGQLRRVLAQVEVAYSNSMIEAWWRSLKHNWLYLNQLETFAALEKLIAFYVEQHNSVIPHAAFAGQTPDEMYFAKGEQVPADLAAARARARQERLAANRALTCQACQADRTATAGPAAATDVPTEAPTSSTISSVLHLHTEKSGMS